MCDANVTDDVLEYVGLVFSFLVKVDHVDPCFIILYTLTVALTLYIRHSLQSIGSVLHFYQLIICTVIQIAINVLRNR